MVFSPKAYNKEYYKKNRETYLARAKARYAADPETARRKNLARYYANRDSHLARMRDQRYGLSPGEFDRMYAAQGEACAICRVPHPPNGKKGLHVDHDHATGRVRGLLCGHCNTILGRAKDDPRVLRAAADYLTPPS